MTLEDDDVADDTTATINPYIRELLEADRELTEQEMTRLRETSDVGWGLVLVRIERTRLKNLYLRVEDAGTPHEAEAALEAFRRALGVM